MSNAHAAGRDIVDINLAGNNNNITVFVDRAGLDADIASAAPKRAFKIMLCEPAVKTEGHPLTAFIADLTKTLNEKGFEIIVAGRSIQRVEAEPIYKAEQRHLADKDCRALLIFACDYVTVSQLTHLTSSLFGHEVSRKEIIVIFDDGILKGEEYFEEGALETARAGGDVIAFSPESLLDQRTIDKIVRRLMLMRHVATSTK